MLVVLRSREASLHPAQLQRQDHQNEPSHMYSDSIASRHLHSAAWEHLDQGPDRAMGARRCCVKEEAGQKVMTSRRRGAATSSGTCLKLPGFDLLAQQGLKVDRHPRKLLSCIKRAPGCRVSSARVEQRLELPPSPLLHSYYVY